MTATLLLNAGARPMNLDYALTLIAAVVAMALWGPIKVV